MDAMKNFRPAWNVNALAQAAGLAALQSEEYLSETLSKLRNEKDALILGLKKLGYQPVSSNTNYFLLPVGSSTQFRVKLLRQGILVRDCASFGLPSYVRIATRTHEENTRLLTALQHLLKGIG
jgi:histidinol-phosphate/aromatic aminotransferase/cobyric acid decarboxylase-like protein